MAKTPFEFGKRLDGAALKEAVVAAKLAREGFYVVQSPIIERKDFDLQTPDLTVYKLDPILMTKHCFVEVKGINSTYGEWWTRRKAEDGLFPVCSEASFLRKYGPVKFRVPNAYVFVPNDYLGTEYNPQGCIKVIMPGTHVYRNRKRYDNVRRSNHRVVLADLDDLEPFEVLVKWLHEKL